MRGRRSVVWVVMTVCLAAGAALVRAGGQGVGQTPSGLPLSQAIRERGSSLTGAYEGWYYGKDGSTYALLGYFNRNTKQEFDIPAGPNNRVEPGGPDQGQPTHFAPGRQWGVFAVKLPKDLGAKRMSWTLVANGFTNTITMHTQADYIIEPYMDAANKNTPPVLRFELGGSPLQGPPRDIVATLGTTLPEPVTLTLYASDDGIVMPDRRAGASPVSVTWSLLRGPGAVTFENLKPSVDKTSGKTTTTAAFSVPGEYVLRAQANDVSGDGGGGFQCCWTNAHVKVIVKGP